MTMRVTLLDLYLGVICLFPIATMLKDGGVLNKLLFALLLVLHICIFFSGPIKKRTLLCLILLIFNYIFMLCSTKFPLGNYNLLAYFPFFLLYTYFMCDNRERVIRWFSRNRRFVSAIMMVWSVLAGISVFVPGCYQVREGGRLYFGSFCKDIFRLGPSAVFIQILTILSLALHGKKRGIGYMILPMYCYLMGSSRTYLVIGFLLLVIAWYMVCSKKAVFWGTILPLSLLMLLLVTISAMGDKIAYTLDDTQYGDFWFRITSSRSRLWTQYLKAWMDVPIQNKLFGNDLEFTYDVAQRWAHNDFIELLCSFGILGLLQYLYAVRLLYKRSYGGVRMPFFVRMCVWLVWLFNAFFNMHYVYFCTMLSYPFLLFAMNRYFAKPKEMR